MASPLSLLKLGLNVNSAVMEEFVHRQSPLDGADEIHVYLRLKRGQNHRCPHCGKKCPYYDRASNYKDEGTLKDRYPSYWRAPDLGTIRVFIHARLDRVYCKDHKVVTEKVPWAYPDCHFTSAFDKQATFLGIHLNKSMASTLLRVDYKSIGRSISRVRKDIEPDLTARFNNLVNIGVDETSYKKGHKYITVVVNHDTSEVVWVHEGHSEATFSLFFEALTPEQRAGIKTVSGDGAKWIDACIKKYCPQAQRNIDCFHVVEWALAALDEVRKDEWREKNKLKQKIEKEVKAKEEKNKEEKEKNEKDKAKDRKLAKELADAKQAASDIKNTRYAVGKNPDNLTKTQRIKLDVIAQASPKLYRAYNLKEMLRTALHYENADDAKEALKVFVFRATHSRLESFKELGHKIKRHLPAILNTIRSKISNARSEGVNSKIKLLIRKARGFRNLENMKDLIYLSNGNLTLTFPGWGLYALKL